MGNATTVPQGTEGSPGLTGILAKLDLTSRFRERSKRVLPFGERTLLYTIPALAFVLLLAIAITRTLYLADQRTALLAQAERELAYATQIAALKNPRTARALLQVAPDSVAGQKATTTLLDPEGKVLVSTGPLAAPAAVQLVRLTGGAFTINTLPKEGIARLSWDGRTSSLTAFYQTGDGLTVVSTLSQTALLSAWMTEVQIELLLLCLLGIAILAIVFSYARQSLRGRDMLDAQATASAQFDTALLRGHCGLWDWDLGRGEVSWSQSMYELLGLEGSRRVLSFTEITDLLHPSDTDVLTVLNDALSKMDGQFDHRFRMRHTHGHWVWLRMRAERVTCAKGLLHLIGIAFDISEQEVLKQKSRSAGLRLAEAIESTSESFVLWDARKRLVLCNSKFRQLYQLSEMEARPGTHYSELTTDGARPYLMEHLAMDEVSAGSTRRFEAQIDNGRWLQISQRRTQDGGFVSIGTDVTEFKQAQARAETTDLRHRRTIEDLRLSQNQLELQAQKLVELAQDRTDQRNKAEAGNRSKSQFLANISHELRTPLNAIIGFSDIMRSRTFGPLGNEKYDEYADDIHESGNFLLGVINDVLDMSKIEAGRFQINPEEMNLHAVVSESMRLISMAADQQQIEVDLKVPDELNITADRRAVKQILLNLLSNAVKFTPEGGKVRVTVKRLRQSVNLVIEDTGVGISRKAMKRLGQPFEQVQDQFTKDHKGSGLGLAIARSLATMHGGSLKIRSELGKGTMVAVRLPQSAKMPEPLEQARTDEAAA
ncbi:MAG: ATP-binding protein [Pseudomonadota bacterium]